MRTTLADQKGAVLIIFAFLLLVLIGFAALATEAGRWYMTRSELSKAVDAAALAGAKNISNPYLTTLAQLNTLVQDFGKENFPSGYAGTPAMGNAGEVTFTPDLTLLSPDHLIKVTGSVTSPAYLAQLFGVNQVATNTAGIAKKNKVEIMLVLDRSGSMDGTPIVDLKKAAAGDGTTTNPGFISFFKDTQAEDKVGLISFATGVTVDFPLGNNYVDTMTIKINAMTAVGATNAEDALAQSYGTYGLTDQRLVAGDKRVQQFVIFFTDGNPTAFRGTFKYEGVDNIDAVVAGTGQTCDQVWPQLGDPNTGAYGSIDPTGTGDGKTTGTSKCSPTSTAKWYVFSTYTAGYSDLEKCYIPYNSGGTLPHYICSTARQMTLAQATTLKDRGVKIYIIGLGGVDKAFLAQVASGPSFENYAPSSSDLKDIFNKIAKEIKLRLVQ